MIKELIETEKELRKEANSYRKTIFDKLKPIFSIIKDEYLDKEDIIHSEKLVLSFGYYSTLDDYRIEDDYLYLHYYEDGYDCYECDEFKIPLEVVEKELQSTTGAVLEWYKDEVDKYLEKQKALQKKKEAKKREKELAELKRLQEKYKNETN